MKMACFLIFLPTNEKGESNKIEWQEGKSSKLLMIQAT